MKKQAVIPFGVFIAVFASHAAYSVMTVKKLSQQWSGLNDVNFLTLYLERSEYLMSASYGLSIGFAAYAILRFLENKNTGLSGILGGASLTGILYVAGCFLVGCCGSPMLAIYLTLFGSAFLGFAKIITFGITVCSIAIGYIWLNRTMTSATQCCVDGECYPTAQ